MGLFSWRCIGCGLSIRNRDTARTEGAGWLSMVTVLLPNGSIVHGTYDGYGQAGLDITDHDGKAAVWHQDCYVHAGRPIYSKASRSASDQGYFTDRWPKRRDDVEFIAPEERD